MKEEITQTLYTDILVIGGGGAGVTAAVAAAREGAKVLLVSKGHIGNSGNTIMIGGSYAMDGQSAHDVYGIEEADATFTKEILFESVLEDGFWINDQNMVEQFVEEGPGAVYEVLQWSIGAGKPFVFGQPATWSMSGNMMGRALCYGLKSTTGIAKLEDIMVIDLLKDENKICGAVCVNVINGTLIEITAKAVILATGGFQPFSFKNTNSDMTGDGQAMAFRAGAQLADMEFMLFLLTAIEPAHMKGSILPLFLTINQNFKYRAVDGQGNEMHVPAKLKELETKSEICKLVHLVYYGDSICSERKSKNGGFYIETLNTPEELDLICKEIEEMFTGFYRKGYYHGEWIQEIFDLLKENGRIEVGLSNEYTVGGILIDETMSTTVPGLYAAGECGSGVFGANRVADALTEMIAHGFRAGKEAAVFAADCMNTVPVNMDEVLLRAKRVFKNEGSMTVGQGIRRLEAISDAELNCVRDEEGLKKALEEYEALEADMAKIRLGSQSLVCNFEWIEYMQLQNRLLCAKVAAMMGLRRKESRGLHIRADYPEIDNEQFCHRCFAEKTKDGIEFSERKPIVTKHPLPESRKIDYKEYLQKADLGLENLTFIEG